MVALLAATGLGIGISVRMRGHAPAAPQGQPAATVPGAAVAPSAPPPAAPPARAPAADGAAPPESFVATDGKRIVVVSTATGKPLRILTDQPAPGESPPRALALSDDRAWVYFTREAGPSHGIYRVALTGGEPVKVGEEPGIGLAVSPNGARLANLFQTATLMIVVHDLTAPGGMRVWSVPERSSIVQFAWHPDGRHLGVLVAPWDGPSKLVVLDTEFGTPATATGPVTPEISGLGGARLVRAPDRGCPITFASYRARRLAVVERCGSATRPSLRLVYLDARTGAVRARPLVLDPKTFARLGHVDFDASGRHLLLFVSGEQLESSTIWRWNGTGKPVRIATGYHQPAW